MDKDIEKLLTEVEALTAVHIGKNAESEPWTDTVARLESLTKLV